MARKPRSTPKKDKAQRPSPPDRDGDGNSGGSLPHNETAPEALGTADEVLAEQQIAEDGLATIIIKGVNTGRGEHHPLGINGKVRKLKLNVEVQVNAEELHALENSHIDFETVVPLQGGADVVEGSSASAEPPVDETDLETETQVDQDAQAEGGEGGPEGGEGGEADPAAAGDGEGETA